MIYLNPISDLRVALRLNAIDLNENSKITRKK